MKRSSPNYLRFLEAVVKALLDEREKTRGPLAEFEGEHGSTFSPYNVREVVAKAEAQVATIEWAGVVEGHGFGIRVPKAFAEQTSPGSWLKVQAGPMVLVRETLMTPEGAVLVVSHRTNTLVKAGRSVEID